MPIRQQGLDQSTGEHVFGQHRHRIGVALLTGALVAGSVAVVAPLARADATEPATWSMLGTPFANKSPAIAVPAYAEDAGPSGSIVAWSEDDASTLNDHTRQLRVGMDPMDGSSVDWSDPLDGAPLSGFRVAADRTTGDAAVMYSEDVPYPDPFPIGGLTPFRYLVATYSGSARSWQEPRELVIDATGVRAVQLAMSGGALHVLLGTEQGGSTLQRLTVHRVPVADGEITSHVVTVSETDGVGFDQTSWPYNPRGAWTPSTPQLAAAPDGSVHVAWTHQVIGDADNGWPSQLTNTTYLASTDATGQAWDDARVIDPTTMGRKRWIHLVRDRERLVAVAQSHDLVNPGTGPYYLDATFETRTSTMTLVAGSAATLASLDVGTYVNDQKAP